MFCKVQVTKFLNLLKPVIHFWCIVKLLLHALLHHNFRIGYAVWLIKKIATENEGKNIEIKIMYDIACLLKKHLRVIFLVIL